MNDAHQFSIHYTREEARRLLPQVEKWLQKLARLHARFEEAAGRVHDLMSPGFDCGGATVEEYLTLQSHCLEILGEFRRRQILVKDLDRGLVDFPALLGGREVFLCWERGEGDIEFWHEMDAGYAGRERL